MALKTLNQYPQHPMDRETSFLFTKLALANDNQVQKIWEEIGSRGIGRILVTRTPETSLVQIDRRVLILTASLINSPGMAVLWAHTLHRLAEATGSYYYFTQFTMDFADGFPDEADYYVAWNAQKDPLNGGNLLDRAEAWA